MAVVSTRSPRACGDGPEQQAALANGGGSTPHVPGTSTNGEYAPVVAVKRSDLHDEVAAAVPWHCLAHPRSDVRRQRKRESE